MGALLYVTADGLLEPLGHSQVVRVVEGLARRGWHYELVSLEKEKDLRDESRVRSLRSQLDAVGVRWQFRPYQERGPRSAALNEWALLQMTLARLSARPVTGIHARAYHGGLVGLAARVTRSVPYLFDTRSYWIDERLEERRWFTTPIRLGVARGVEHQLFAQAAGVVCLTELQADDVRRGAFGATHDGKVACITTCADFDDFQRRPIDACEAIPSSVREAVRGKKVIGLIGSINQSYLVDESLRLAREVLRKAHDTHLLVLSRQGEQYRQLLAALGVPEERFTLASAPHDAMPQWLSVIDWGLMLLRDQSPAKRASMPTKLAEFLASGVRPIQFGCNEEVAHWVRATKTGIVLDDVSSLALEAAASKVATAQWEPGLCEAGRALAAPHFALASGLTKYDLLLRSVFGGSRSSV